VIHDARFTEADDRLDEVVEEGLATLFHERSNDFSVHAWHISFFAPPAAVKLGDYLLGMEVTAIGAAQHVNAPALRFTVVSNTADQDDVGRIVVKVRNLIHVSRVVYFTTRKGWDSPVKMRQEDDAELLEMLKIASGLGEIPFEVDGCLSSDDTRYYEGPISTVV
jgi:hypothetical protein